MSFKNFHSPKIIYKSEDCFLNNDRDYEAVSSTKVLIVLLHFQQNDVNNGIFPFFITNSVFELF